MRCLERWEHDVGSAKINRIKKYRTKFIFV
jgi:hypothetical protein